MKQIFLSGLMMVTIAGCAPAKTENTAQVSMGPGYELPHYKRVNLVVADLDRSLTIYQDILGFEPGTIMESGLDSFSYTVFNFPKEARLRYVYLGEPDEKRVFGLTEATGIDLPLPPSAPYINTSVIGITDLEAKFKKLEAMGLTVTPSKISGGAEFKFIEQAFIDFDGHMIVYITALHLPGLQIGQLTPVIITIGL